jgi:hypothetical protein
MESTLTAFSAIVLFIGCFAGCGRLGKHTETDNESEEMLSGDSDIKKKDD